MGVKGIADVAWCWGRGWDDGEDDFGGGTRCS